MATSIDKESVREAYNKIRDDSSEDNWAVFKVRIQKLLLEHFKCTLRFLHFINILSQYDGNRIVMSATGVDYSEFLSLFDGGWHHAVVQNLSYA